MHDEQIYNSHCTYTDTDNFVFCCYVGLVLMPFANATTRVRAMLEAHGGQEAILRRLGNSPPDDVELIVKIDSVDDQPVAGGVQQFRRKVIASNAEIATASWPGPPRRGDLVLISSGTKTLTVQSVDTKVVNGARIMHVMIVLGS